MTDFAYSYAGIVKSEKQSDGTLKVYGKATDDSIDIDKQICDEAWLAKAMPDWFVSGGNIREQHSSIAAGVATDYEKKADGHYITALIVDPTSVKKVETGVLKGFSIGIRSPRVIRDEKAAGGRIVDGQIVEISVVDRPANPNAKLMLAKAADGGELMAVEQIDIPTPGDVFKTVDAPVEAEVVAEVVEEIVADETVVAEVVAEEIIEAEAEKSVDGDIVKFDQDLYDTALKALSGLLGVEASEAGEGHDESESFHHLLKAIKHLKKWYKGEVEEGEVANPDSEMLDDEVVADYDNIDLSADADKCDKCDMAVKDCKCADKSADADDTVVEAEAAAEETLVETTDEATDETSEVDRLKSALDAEIEKATRLEAELELAKSAVVAGGPRRSAITKAVNTSEILVKAIEYRKKAAATTDRVLREGYEALAVDLEKSLKGQK